MIAFGPDGHPEFEEEMQRLTRQASESAGLDKITNGIAGQLNGIFSSFVPDLSRVVGTQCRFDFMTKIDLAPKLNVMNGFTEAWTSKFAESMLAGVGMPKFFDMPDFKPSFPPLEFAPAPTTDFMRLIRMQDVHAATAEDTVAPADDNPGLPRPLTLTEVRILIVLAWALYFYTVAYAFSLAGSTERDLVKEVAGLMLNASLLPMAGMTRALWSKDS
jgi:hypothetical protein